MEASIGMSASQLSQADSGVDDVAHRRLPCTRSGQRSSGRGICRAGGVPSGVIHEVGSELAGGGGRALSESGKGIQESRDVLPVGAVNIALLGKLRHFLLPLRLPVRQVGLVLALTGLEFSQIAPVSIGIRVLP